MSNKVGIHILNRGNGKITGYYTNTSKKMMVLDNLHTRNRDEHSETFDFTVPYKYLDDFHNQNRVLIPDTRKDEFREFVIKHKETSEKEIFIQCDGAWLDDLSSNSEPIAPVNMQNITVDEAVSFALTLTTYKKGEVEFDGFIDLVTTEYMRPYDILLMIEEMTGLQFDVTIETSGSEITGRYVHMRESEDLSDFTGKELVRGKDIVTIKQKEDTRELVTALKLTSTDKDGKPLVTEVYDDDAINRWGNDGEPIWGLHHFEATEKTDMTIAKMQTTGKKILKKKINQVVEYEVQAIEVENQLGVKANFGDRIRVRDVVYQPHFYMEATVKSVQRDIFDDSTKQFTLGAIKKYSESTLRAYFNSLRAELQTKMNDNINNIDKVTVEIRDSVATEGEKVRLKTLLMRLEKDRAVNLNSYNDLINSEYISSSIKSELVSTKTTYDNSLETIINKIATALNDNIVVPSETLDINNEVSNYNTALSNLTLVIQKSLKNISDNMAINRSKETVDALEIGVNNLIDSDSIKTTSTLVGNTKTLTHTAWSVQLLDKAWILNKLKPNTEYTMTYNVKLLSKPTYPIGSGVYGAIYLYSASTTNDEYMGQLTSTEYTSMNVGSVVKVKKTFTTPPTFADDSQILIYSGYHKDTTTGETQYANMEFSNIMFVEGNKASEYQPAPEDLKVGTRNLLLNSKNRNDYSVGLTAFNYTRYMLSQPLEVGKTYTFALKYKIKQGDNKGVVSVYPYNPNMSIYHMELAQNTYGNYTFTATQASKEFLVYSAKAGTTDCQNTSLDLLEAILVEGNKVGTWLPAPEDITAEITNSINNFANLQTEVARTFKDGILDDAEYVRLKTIMNEIDKDKTDLTTNVNDLQLHAYLTSSLKTTLTTLKTSYDNAHKDLLDNMTVVINDKKIISSENTLINTKLTAYNNALSNINTHIQKCLNDISDNLAKGRSAEAIDALEIGGRNLIPNSNDFNIFTAYTGYTRTIQTGQSVTEWNATDATRLTYTKVGSTLYGGLCTTPMIQADKGKQVVYSFYIKNVGTTRFRISFNGLSVKSVSHDSYIEPQESIRYYVVGYMRTDYDWFQHQIYPEKEGDVIDVVMWRRKLEYGNKPTDYTPAPEDITYEIEQAMTNFANLETTVSQSFKDGIIQESEAIALKTHLARIDQDYQDLNNIFIPLYNHPILSGTTEKTNLYNAKIAFNTSHKTLRDTIVSYIGDGKITPSENTTVDSLLNDYKGKVGELQSQFKACDEAITTGKINNIVVGGRNMITNSDFTWNLTDWNVHHGTTATKSTAYNAYLFSNPANLFVGTRSPKFKVTQGETYTLTIEGSRSNNMTQLDYVYLMYDTSGVSNQFLPVPAFKPTSGEFSRISVTFTASASSDIANILVAKRPSTTVGAETTQMFYIRNIKLEVGNKATDWSPAPEDTKKSIQDLQDDLNGYKNTVNTTFKDGIITEAEAKALNQQKLSLEVEKKNFDKQYEAVNGNSILTGTTQKANLESAYSSYAANHKTLLDSVTNAISDGKATSSESSAVTTNFTNYQNALGLLAQRLEEATDAISTGKVDKITIGGKNILRNSDFSKQGLYWAPNGTASYEVVDGYSVAKITNATRAGIYQTAHTSLVEPEIYTLSFRAKAVGTTSRIEIGFLNQSIGRSSFFDLTNTWKTYSYTFVNVPSIATLASVTFHIYSTTTSQQGFYITQVQLEKGNKPTDWTPSVEDVNASIDEKTPKKEIIATINASGENVTIDGNKININGNTTFSNTYQDVNGIKNGTTKVNPNIFSNVGITNINGGNIIADNITLKNVNFVRADGAVETANGVSKLDNNVVGCNPRFTSLTTDGSANLAILQEGQWFVTARQPLIKSDGSLIEPILDAFYFTHTRRYLKVRYYMKAVYVGLGVKMTEFNYDTTKGKTIDYSFSATASTIKSQPGDALYQEVLIDLGVPTYTYRSFYLRLVPGTEGNDNNLCYFRMFPMVLQD
ncbi:hypothetical protein [Macrococcoides caseolyticum]|uniref:hypothetical protein n=1 Tax=Macrococcoides caseolyticum TaxID=69966 RepID=UPI001F183C50|nr:hypothetical protein [Macrococcus caseolyticus]MCE4957250.1 hypothetical protein [Macrococcus caseolyticus]